MIYLTLLLTSAAFAQNYITTSYYGTPPDKFRVELASHFSKSCSETKLARKIFFESSDELREIAIMRDNGKWEEGGASNKPKLMEEVDSIFAHALPELHPCQKKDSVPVQKPGKVVKPI